MVTIGWSGFYVQFCAVGNLFVRIPNYIQVGQFAVFALAIIVGEEIIRRGRR
jgi:hypothetical protein